jgi:hypothetical protein
LLSQPLLVKSSPSSRLRSNPMNCPPSSLWGQLSMPLVSLSGGIMEGQEACWLCPKHRPVGFFPQRTMLCHCIPGRTRTAPVIVLRRTYEASFRCPGMDLRLLRSRIGLRRRNRYIRREVLKSDCSCVERGFQSRLSSTSPVQFRCRMLASR